VFFNSDHVNIIKNSVSSIVFSPMTRTKNYVKENKICNLHIQTVRCIMKSVHNKIGATFKTE
jgi:hypothetical protein